MRWFGGNVLAAKYNDLSLIPGTHMKGKINSPKLFSVLYQYTIAQINNIKKIKSSQSGYQLTLLQRKPSGESVFTREKRPLNSLDCTGVLIAVRKENKLKPIPYLLPNHQSGTGWGRMSVN